MIKVSFSKTNENINKLIVEDHAGYAEHGEDIVCAGASMLCYAIANQILNITDSVDIKVEDAFFSFENNSNNSDVELLLNTLLNGLFMIKEQYGKFIEIKEV